MDQLLETIDLDMEESNELAFKIKVEGTANSPAKVRLVCESSDVSYMFNGRGTAEEGVVQFVLPQMKDKLQEGTYSARVEVLIENRYFSPVQFQINFKKALKVVAESIFVAPRAAKPEISVSAAPIMVAKPTQQARPVVIESAPQPVVQAASRVVEKKEVVPVQAPPPKKPAPAQVKTEIQQKPVPKLSKLAESSQLTDELIAELTRSFSSPKRKG